MWHFEGLWGSRFGRQLVEGADVEEQKDEEDDRQRAGGKHADPQIPHHVHPAAADKALGLHAVK